MASIVHSELAPEGAVHYSLANEEFDLGDGSDSFETDDRAVISNANAHPWLDVEVDVEEQLGGDYAQGSLTPEEDALSALNSVAFDADAIRAAEEAKTEDVEEEAPSVVVAAPVTDDDPEEIKF